MGSKVRNTSPTTDRCPATAKQSGEPCKLTAGFGTDHLGFGLCRFHGGTSKAAKKHAAGLQATWMVEIYGLPREVDPHTALIEELYRTAGHVAWLGQKVGSFKEDSELTAAKGGGQGGLPEVTETVWLTMYRAERVHLAKIAKSCIDVGIEERRVRLAEEQGALLARVINGILSDLGVADDERTPAVVRKHLQLVA